MRIKPISVMLLMFILLISLVSAIPFTPQGNVDLKNHFNMTNLSYFDSFIMVGNILMNSYSITGATDINTTNLNSDTISDGTLTIESGSIINATDINGTRVSMTGNITTDSWFDGFYNWIINTDVSSLYVAFNGSVLTFNESKLNSTIHLVSPRTADCVAAPLGGVGDYTGNTAIKECIDYVTTNNMTTVYVKKGHYYTIENITLPDGLILKGEGIGQTIIERNASVQDHCYTTYEGTQAGSITNQEVHIEDISFISGGWAPNDTCYCVVCLDNVENSVVTGCSFNGSGDDAYIRTNKMGDVWGTNNLIENSFFYGQSTVDMVGIDGWEHSVIQNNYFEKADGACLTSGSGKRLTFQDNNFKDCTSAISCEGFNTSQGIFIKDNIIENATYVGIAFWTAGGTFDLSDIEVSGNSIKDYNGSRGAVSYNNVTNLRISDNTFYNVTSAISGDNSYNMFIYGNKIHNATVKAIAVINGCDNVSVDNNIIFDAVIGVYVNSGKGTILDNDFYAVTTPTSGGATANYLTRYNDGTTEKYAVGTINATNTPATFKNVTSIYGLFIERTKPVRFYSSTLASLRAGILSNTNNDLLFESGVGTVRMLINGATGQVSVSKLNATQINTTYLNGNSTWQHQDYPASCPGSSAITQLGDSVTCQDLWVDEAGDSMTGNLDMTDNNITDVDVLTATEFVGNLTGTADVATTWDGETSQASLNVNSSDYWDSIGYPNATVFTTTGGVLGVVKTWWGGLYCQLTGCTMAGNIAMGTNAITGAGASDFTTINTGFGDNELYDMDQNVLTTDGVSFENGTFSEAIYLNRIKPLRFYSSTVASLRAGILSNTNNDLLFESGVGTVRMLINGATGIIHGNYFNTTTINASLYQGNTLNISNTLYVNKSSLATDQLFLSPTNVLYGSKKWGYPELTIGTNFYYDGTSFSIENASQNGSGVWFSANEIYFVTYNGTIDYSQKVTRDGFYQDSTHKVLDDRDNVSIRDDMVHTSGDNMTGALNMTANHVYDMIPNLGSPTPEVDISGGAITITGGYMAIDTESDSATDALITINGGTVGDLIILTSLDSARDINITTGGNIVPNGQYDLVNNNYQIMLILHSDGYWKEVSRSHP